MMNQHDDDDNDVDGFEVEEVVLQQQQYQQKQQPRISLTKIQHAELAALNCMEQHHLLPKAWNDKNILDDDDVDEDADDDEETDAGLNDQIIVDENSQYANTDQQTYEVAYHPEKGKNVAYRPLPSCQPDRTASILDDASMNKAAGAVAALVPPHAFVARGDALPRPSSSTLNSMRPYHAPSLDEDDEREDRLKYNNNRRHSTPTFHPALKAAVCAQGQEAVWREDVYSDVTSVVMAPPTPVQRQKLQQKKDTVANKPKRKSLLPFHLPGRFSRKKKNDEQIQTSETAQSTPATPTPIRMHVKTSKIKKTVVLLPQEQDGNAGQGSINVNHARRQEVAAAHMIQARQLLNQALVLDQSNSSGGSHVKQNVMATRRQSEELAKVAFEHATAARRIMMVEESNEEEEEEKATNVGMDNNNNDDKANNLDEVLSCLAEKGHDAAIQHQRIVLSMSDGNDIDDNGSKSEVAFENYTPIAGTMKERNGKTPKKGFLSEYASRAVHYLESILPKNITSDEQDNLHTALSDDFWSDAGISTLGMKNDTFEYFLSSDGPSQQHSELNTDLMSLSSLNEILDGPNEESDEAGAATSPRAALSVIDVPRRKPTKSRQKYQTPRRARGLLGLVSPLSTKSILKPNNNGKDLAIVRTIPEDQSVGGTSQQSQCSSEGKGWGGVFRETKDSTDVLFVTEEEFLQPIEKDDTAEPTTQEDDDQSGAFVLQEIVHTDTHRLMSPGNKSIGSEFNFPTRDIDKYKSIYSNKGSSYQMQFEEEPSDMKVMAIPEEAEWDEEVYERNIQVVLMAGQPITTQNEITPDYISQVLIAPTNDDWDDRHDPQSIAVLRPSDTITSPVEPVGKTPKYQPSSAPTPLPRPTVPENTCKEDEQCKKEEAVGKNDQSDCSLLPVKKSVIKKLKEQSVVSSPASSRHTKDTTEKSIGSKTQIFGRIVGMLGKRDPLVPTAVVEDTYIVRKGASKAEKVTTKKAQKATMDQMVLDKGQTRRNQKPSGLPSTKLAKDSHSIPNMVDAATKLKRKHSNRAPVVADDNTAVLEKAISNGNLKAIQSNEEEDDTPANYLEIMLKKKVKNERHKARQHRKECAECDNRSEPDSYVEKIRGGRHQEVPGLALEEAATRDAARDPDDNDTRLRNLAPTPRRAKTSTAEMVLEANNKEDHDPPMDDDLKRSEERERRRAITERLYAAGSSNFEADEEAKCDILPTTDDIGVEEKVEQEYHGDLMMAPTVESAESYEGSTDNAVDNTEAKSETVIPNKSKKSNNIVDRSRRISRSFLPGIRKLHI